MTSRVRSSDDYVDGLLEEAHRTDTKPQRIAAAVQQAGFDLTSEAGKRALEMARRDGLDDPWKIAHEAEKAGVVPVADTAVTPETFRQEIEAARGRGDFQTAARLERQLKRRISGPVDSDGRTEAERARVAAERQRREERAGEIWRDQDPLEKIEEGAGIDPNHLRADYVIEGEMVKAREEGDFAAAARLQRELERKRAADKTQHAATSTSPEPELSMNQRLVGYRQAMAEAREAGDYVTAASYERRIRSTELELAELQKARVGG